MTTGTDILAVAPGTVVIADVGNWHNFGRTIVIAHSNNYYTQYSHLDGLLVGVGDTVVAGQHIAESGNTGPISTGAHLHLGTRQGGYDNNIYAVDPFGWRGSGRDPLFNYNSKESVCLWNGKPGDQFCCSDIIVEDDGDGWTQDPNWDTACSGQPEGSWARCGSGNGLRQHWTYSWNPADYWVEWRPPLRYSGYYKIYAFIPLDNSTTSSARYLIRRNDLVSINQNASNHFWAPLGTRWLERNDLVYLGDYTGEPNSAKQVVADAMKFTAAIVYLPDVKNSSEWLSSMVIRNNTSSSANVTIHYYNANGGLVATQPPFTIAGSGNATITPPVGFSGSVVIVSSEDVSVIVNNINASSGHTYSYNAIAAADPLNPGGGQVGADIHLPLLMDNNNGWNTETTMLNTGAQTAYVQFTYYDASGNAYPGFPGYPGGYPLAPNASFTYQQSGTYCPTVGAARLTSDQPIAVTVREIHSNGSTMAYNGFSGGAATVSLPSVLIGAESSTSPSPPPAGPYRVYMPLVMAGERGWKATLAVQNLGATQTNITVQYYPSTGYGVLSSQTIYNVQPHATAIFVPSSTGLWVGAARITNSAGQPVAAVVNQTNGGQAAGYSGLLDGSSFIVLPYVRSDGGWTTGVQVQNLDGSTANVVVKVNGSQVWSGTIGAYSSVTLYPLAGSGSATVECTNSKRIAAIARITGIGPGDQAGDYSGVNR